jgi:hypothetical protein
LEMIDQSSEAAALPVMPLSKPLRVRNAII